MLRLGILVIVGLAIVGIVLRMKADGFFSAPGGYQTAIIVGGLLVAAIFVYFTEIRRRI